MGLVSERLSFDNVWERLYRSTSVCKRALTALVAGVVAMRLL
jgi:hypothetical protein